MVAGFIVALGLIGALLLVAGLRGRRIDDHPWCRKCRFDLVGSWPASKVCPECGADLVGAKAVGDGQRVKRRGLLWPGVLLLITAITLGCFQASGRLSTINWNAYKPTWWLTHDLHSDDAESADAALIELARRSRVHTLTASQRETTIAYILEQVVPGTRTTTVDWFRLLESAWLDGVLSPEQKEIVCRCAMANHLLTTSPQDLDGESAFIQVHADRIYSTQIIQLDATATLVSARFDDQNADAATELSHDEQTTPIHGLYDEGWHSVPVSRHAVWAIRLRVPPQMAPGPHVLHTTWRIDCFNCDSETNIASWTEDHTAQINMADP